MTSFDGSMSYFVTIVSSLRGKYSVVISRSDRLGDASYQIQNRSMLEPLHILNVPASDLQYIRL